jgi:ribose 5-phosphate isomerase B
MEVFNMKIGIGSDHGGYRLKEDIKKYLEEKGIEYVDFGADSANTSVDYPKFGLAVAEAVVNKEIDKGIVCCGTGIGISLAANKVPGIRCAVVSDTFSAKMSRAHNNANMLSLGERVLGRGLALEIVEAWLNEEFEGDRHQKRVDMLSEIEKKYNK